jgi:hypothetical protein
MSVSTDAILFFGFLLEEGVPHPWEDEKYDGWEEWLAEIFGVELPDRDWDSLTEEEQGQVWDEYNQAKREALGGCKIELVTHCSDSYSMYAIGIKESITTAWRGYAQPVNPDMKVKIGWVEDLMEVGRAFDLELVIYNSDEHKKDTTGKLGWWLVSYWG